jgi:hypothetical protein
VLAACRWVSCIKDCLLLQASTTASGAVALKQCQCVTNFYWSGATFNCVKCPAGATSDPSKPTTGSDGLFTGQVLGTATAASNPCGRSINALIFYNAYWASKHTTYRRASANTTHALLQAALTSTPETPPAAARCAPSTPTGRLVIRALA